MCGRTGLSLCSADVRLASCYKIPKHSTYKTPKWIDEYNLGKSYNPSYNVAPTDVTPVLVPAQNFGSGDDNEIIMKPMMWGMVPPWHKGDYKSHGLSTNNCRLESVASSKLYGSALRNGNRCVILAEGFYEWQTTKKDSKTKQPYYIYAPQPEGVNVEDPASWSKDFDEENGWSGINLLKLAGLYNVWTSEEGALYSYSVITMEANSTLDWLHHRMPAVLTTNEQVMNWLNVSDISSNKSISMLEPVKQLSWHCVSTLVNNSRNKSSECNQQIPLDNKATSKPDKLLASQKMMSSWLSSGKARKRLSENGGQDNSKMKKM